eukprot:1363996-Amorphochlora_amoeboformis.AAC.1
MYPRTPVSQPPGTRKEFVGNDERGNLRPEFIQQFAGRTLAGFMLMWYEIQDLVDIVLGASP